MTQTWFYLSFHELHFWTRQGWLHESGLSLISVLLWSLQYGRMPLKGLAHPGWYLYTYTQADHWPHFRIWIRLGFILAAVSLHIVSSILISTRWACRRLAAVVRLRNFHLVQREVDEGVCSHKAWWDYKQRTWRLILPATSWISWLFMFI